MDREHGGVRLRARGLPPLVPAPTGRQEARGDESHLHVGPPARSTLSARGCRRRRGSLTPQGAAELPHIPLLQKLRLQQPVAGKEGEGQDSESDRK